MSGVLPSDLDGRAAVLEPPKPSAEKAEPQEWEPRARAWLSTLPRRRNVTTDEMDGWIDSNLPDELKSHPRSQLYGRIISLHKLIRRSDQVPLSSLISLVHFVSRGLKPKTLNAKFKPRIFLLTTEQRSN